MEREEIARMAHEANAAYCRMIGDFSQPRWNDAPEWQKKSSLNGVHFIIENPTAGPEASHDNWYAQKLEEGWHYGPKKDPERKTHPCMVPFHQLPFEQRAKDCIFGAVVRACLSMNGAE